MCNHDPTSYRHWHRYEEDEPTEWLHFDTSSELCFLQWLHFEISCAWKRVLLCLFSPHLKFFIKDIQQGIISYQIRQLSCHARWARAHWSLLCSHLPFRMDSFVHGNIFFFSVNWWIGVYKTKSPLIDRLVCTIQSNQTHILYCGQLEICLSV